MTASTPRAASQRASSIVVAVETTRAPHPFTARDMASMQRVSDPQVSPDGRQVVFAVSELNLEENRRRADLWAVGTDGHGLKRLVLDFDQLRSVLGASARFCRHGDDWLADVAHKAVGEDGLAA